MPRGGIRSTWHRKEGGWEYWSFPFSPTVLVAEKKILWYDIKKFRYLKYLLKKEGVQFYWNEPTDEQKHRKHSGAIELYKKYPKDTPFLDKLRDIQNIIKRYGL